MLVHPQTVVPNHYLKYAPYAINLRGYSELVDLQEVGFTFVLLQKFKVHSEKGRRAVSIVPLISEDLVRFKYIVRVY